MCQTLHHMANVLNNFMPNELGVNKTTSYISHTPHTCMYVCIDTSYTYLHTCVYILLMYNHI